MNGNNTTTDPMIEALLKSSLEAAEKIRKEQGLWARLIAYLERKSEMRHEIKKLKLENKWRNENLARCRKGEHDIQNWTKGQETTIYARGADPKHSLPTHYQRSWVGHCIHCGSPEVIKKNV